MLGCMGLIEQIDEVLLRSGREMTAHQIAGAMRELFTVRMAQDVLETTLAAEASWMRHGDLYATRGTRRADWLVAKFGLAA